MARVIDESFEGRAIKLDCYKENRLCEPIFPSDKYRFCSWETKRGWRRGRRYVSERFRSLTLKIESRFSFRVQKEKRCRGWVNVGLCRSFCCAYETAG
jgi:hypothetical protein